MKTIAFVRHAKSDWGTAATDDRSRPLAARGERDAPRMGAWLGGEASWQRALVSPAVRAQQTFAALALDVPFDTIDNLYPTQSGNVLRMLQGLDDGLSSVLIIGHNPGISNAVRNFLQAPPDDPKLEDMPTCACAIVEFAAQNWAALDFGQAALAGFMTPKMLKKL